MQRQIHWEHVYETKRPSDVSWYTPEARLSLDLIRRVAPPPAAILDAGGGASTLVDGLLKARYERPTVLDLSAAALAAARQRLGPEAVAVEWVHGDVLDAPLPDHAYDVWHDRAVFHFLVEPSDRRRYVSRVSRAVKHGGHVLVATFGPEGPLRCSGLEVMRYSADALHAEFGAGFGVVDSQAEDHVTPAGVHQAFIYCLCRVE